MNILAKTAASAISNKTKAVFIAAAALTCASVAASTARAAGQCSAIKASLEKNGTYLHHYRDPAHPDLDLYQRYVTSSLQCGGGYGQQSTPVATVVGCELPSCVKYYGDGNR